MRGQKVMIDADLAELYGVETKRLNEQVKRNRERFPEYFMFQLTSAEKDEVVANCDHLAKLKFSKALPYAFTGHGAIRAANVLNSPRAFVRLRELIASHKELAHQMDELETRIERKLESHDQAITGVINTIRELMKAPEIKKRPIGFVPPQEKNSAAQSATPRIAGVGGMLLF